MKRWGLLALMAVLVHCAFAQRPSTNSRWDTVRANAHIAPDGLLPKGWPRDTLRYLTNWSSDQSDSLNTVAKGVDSLRARAVTLETLSDSLRNLIVVSTAAEMSTVIGELFPLAYWNNSLRGGLFVYRDSAYSEVDSIVAVNATTVGKQWVRVKFEEEKTVYSNWAGMVGDTSNEDGKMTKLTKIAAQNGNGKVQMLAGAYRFNTSERIDGGLSGSQRIEILGSESRNVTFLMRAQNDTITRTALYLSGGGVVIIRVDSLIEGMSISSPAGTLFWINRLDATPYANILRIADTRAGGAEWTGNVTFGEPAYVRSVYWVRNYLLINDTSNLTVGMDITGLGGSVSSTIISIPDTGFIVRTGAHTLTDSTGTPTFIGGSSAEFATNDGLDTVVVSGIRMVGANNGATNYSMGIHLNPNASVIIARNSYFESLRNALKVDGGAATIDVDGCEFVGGGQSDLTARGVVAVGNFGARGLVRVTNSTIKHYYFNPFAGLPAAGIYSPSTNDWFIDNVKFHDIEGEAMQCYPRDTSYAGTQLISNSQLVGGTKGGLFFLYSGGRGGKVSITNCVIDADTNLNSNWFGYHLAGLRGTVNITGGSMRGCQYRSILTNNIVFTQDPLDTAGVVNVSGVTYALSNGIHSEIGYGTVKISNVVVTDSVSGYTFLPGSRYARLEVSNSLFKKHASVWWYPDSTANALKGGELFIHNNTVLGNLVVGSWNGAADTGRVFFVKDNDVTGTSTFAPFVTTQRTYYDKRATTTFDTTATRKAIPLRGMTTSGILALSLVADGDSSINTILSFKTKTDSAIVYRTGADTVSGQSFWYKWIAP